MNLKTTLIILLLTAQAYAGDIGGIRLSLDRAMITPRIQSTQELGDEIIDPEGNVVNPEKDRNWHVYSTPFSATQQAFRINIVRILEQVGKGTVVFAGPGDGTEPETFLNMLEREGIEGYRVVGMGDLYFPKWKKGKADYIHDYWSNLTKYFRAGEVVLIMSNLGFTHVPMDELPGLLSSFSPALSPDCQIIFNYMLLTDEASNNIEKSGKYLVYEETVIDDQVYRLKHMGTYDHAMFSEEQWEKIDEDVIRMDAVIDLGGYALLDTINGIMVIELRMDCNRIAQQIVYGQNAIKLKQFEKASEHMNRIPEMWEQVKNRYKNRNLPAVVNGAGFYIHSGPIK